MTEEIKPLEVVYCEINDNDILLSTHWKNGGTFALGGSIIGGVARTVDNASKGLTIGKTGVFEKAAENLGTNHYEGLKEFNIIKSIFGNEVAEKIGWWQNKNIINGVMNWKGIIYDAGGELTGAYAKEKILTDSYKHLVDISSFIK